MLNSGCGQFYQGKGWPTSLNAYVYAFKAECDAHKRDIPDSYLTGLTVSFGDVEAACNATAIGCCRTFVGSNRRDVTISDNFWQKASDGYKYELIFHELGHCLLDFEHRGVKDELTGYPTSVMTPMIFSGDYFQTHLNSYMDEFFAQ